MDTIDVAYMKEQLRLFRKWHPLGCVARPLKHDDGSVNYAVWECAVPGRKGTHWEGGLFKLYLILNNYPRQPPLCRFCPPIFHPNIDSNDEERTMMVMGPPGPPPPYSEEPPSSQELVRPTDEQQQSVHNDDPHRVVEASHETNSQIFIRPPRADRSAPPPYTPRSEPTHNPDREANNDSADVRYPQRRPRKPKGACPTRRQPKRPTRKQPMRRSKTVVKYGK